MTMVTPKEGTVSFRVIQILKEKGAMDKKRFLLEFPDLDWDSISQALNIMRRKNTTKKQNDWWSLIL